MPRARLRPELASGIQPGTFTVTSITNTDTPYSMSVDEELILADTTAGVITVNLPAVADARELVYMVKKIDAVANDVTVATPGAETIDGAATVLLSAQWDTLQVVSDGSNWYKVGGV